MDTLPIVYALEALRLELRAATEAATARWGVGQVHDDEFDKLIGQWQTTMRQADDNARQALRLAGER